MNTSRILRIRYLARVALALSLTLASVGSAVPVALGYDDGLAATTGVVDAPASWDRLAGKKDANGLGEDSLFTVASKAGVEGGDAFAASGAAQLVRGLLQPIALSASDVEKFEWIESEASNELSNEDGRVFSDEAPLSPESVGEAALASNGSTWTVCASGCNYTTIQAAIDAEAASDGDTITIAAGTYYEHVTVNKSLTLQGSTEGDTIVDGSSSDRVFTIESGKTVTLENLTITNGRVVSSGAAAMGGGIFVVSSSNDPTLTLNNCAVSNNSASSSGGAAMGGGIFNGGTLTLNNSTLSGNSADDDGDGGDGGGIYNGYLSTLTLNNSTISGNSAGDDGGGIYNGHLGTLTLNNSTISDNSATYGGGILQYTATVHVKNTILAGNTPRNCMLLGGAMNSRGYNLESGTDCGFTGTGDRQNADPLLGPLQDNGGPTFTHALLEGSPTIDAGSCTDIDGNPVPTDQRGMPRPQGVGCDIGAFESMPRTNVITVTTADDEFGENLAGCSLREAIQAANSDDFFGGCPGGIGADTIILPAGAYTLTIAGADEDANAAGDLDIPGDMTIIGAGANTTVIDAGGIDRVMDIQGDNTVVIIKGVTLTGGRPAEGGGGGGIRNYRANLTVDGVTVTGNTVDSGGGGIHNGRGTLTVRNSTLSSNSANVGGGLNSYMGTVTIINSTISSNNAAQGGGLRIKNGSGALHFSTVVQNSASSAGSNIKNTGSTIDLFATIVANPQGAITTNCSGALNSLGGYNRISDSSCHLQNITVDDQENATVELEPLADNGGPTLTHKPVPRETVVDIMPRSVCESFFDGLGLDALDQRGKGRPAWGIRQEGVIVVEGEWQCDAGAVELGAETLLVCGPPLAYIDPLSGDLVVAPGFTHRCTWGTIDEALQEAQTGDNIVVSGVVTETVTVSKTVIIRGPAIEEATPGAHIGIVQAALNEPDGDGAPGSVFTITEGPSVTIKDLNIRHGDADQGGGINNAADLTLEGVTIYANHAITGGAVYNSGTLRVTNSTIVTNTASSGAGIYSASTATVIHVTLADNDGSNIHNGGTPGSVVVSGTILSAPSSGGQCSGDVTSDGYNLLHGGDCFTTQADTDVTGDPQLGPLRDNGGPTLTRAISADSAAVEAGPLEADCAVATDQRGKPRPFDMPGGGGARCDVGAVEYGPLTLTVCENCDADPEELRFNDLQEALDRAMAGDTVAIEAGAYTGNFIAYKDVTLQHAGIDVATLSRDQPVDVRAILQASERTLREQHRLLDPDQASGLSGTVLTVQAYHPLASTGTIAVTDDVTVTLRGLTLRHGLSRQGGGIYNVGHLSIIKSTISENAAVNELDAGGDVVADQEARGAAIYNVGQLTLERSTISGNRSEYYGGAIYTVGSDSQEATVDVVASTIANNKAEKLPRQHVINITDAGFDPIGLTVDSGDEIQFQDRTAEAHTLLVPAGMGCTPEGEIVVPRMGAGLSEPLVCTVSEGQVIITVSDSENSALSIQIEVNALSFTPKAHAIYATGSSEVSEVNVARSIVVHSAGSGQNCKAVGLYASIGSGKYNLVSDSSCNLTDGTDLRPGQEGYGGVELGPLQDNNAIDHERNLITGYTHTHALRPGSSAIDWIPTAACGAASQPINIASGNLDLAIHAGDIVTWAHTVASTVAIRDGEADVNLVAVPANGSSREVQLAEPGSYPYRVYDNDSQAEIAHGTIEVESRTRETDQRGTTLPQRGTHDGTYNCDVGAYEFQPWVVGQPLPRPPAAVGTQPPRWNVGGEENTENVQSYHATAPGTAQDYALRPSPDDGDADLEDSEIVTVYWETDPDPASQAEIVQYSIVEWPDDPQIHVSGAGVNLLHDGISDGFQVSGAQAFEGLEKEDVTVLSSGVFSRTVSSEDSYSVLQFAKGHQTNVTLKVQVVRTVDWNTPGVRDMRAERAVCEIGSEIRYRAFEDDAGELPGHEDPEGKAGQILDGDVFDGVHTEGDLATAQNTVDDLVPPAHIQNTREGPIIPILNTTTTFADSNLVSGGHDLRVAWYRPDGRNVAWPVKTVGYRCEWPADPPEIVIASELGSEIGGQPVLSSDRYSDLTVYHQSDPNEPGFNPNDEHALLAASNLGNAAPALYALRTDLWDPSDKQNTSEPYALLKYCDPREEDQIKIQIYKVVLTREAEEIMDITPDPGAITLLASAAAAAANLQYPISSLQSQPSVTLRIGDGELPPGGDVTVPVEALGARDLRSATIKVSYDPTKLTPTACTTNRLDFVEALYNLQISTDEPAQPFRTVHMRASLDAGTDAQYEWNFGDGTTRIAGAEVSHVYGAVGTYTVVVTATNGLFDPVTADTQVEVAEGTVPGSLDEDDTSGCRIETEGELTIELKSRNKHGLSGDLLLSELTFEAVSDPPAADTTTDLDLASITLFGPGYEDLKFNISAGNPVYAPTPLRGLLDIQPCEQTRAADVAARPFWKDFKGMLWARAAGDMEVLYYYPLQAGFHLTDDHAESLGLVDGDGNVLPPDDRVGQCIPWMDKMVSGIPDMVPHAITTAADGAQSVYAADVDGDGDLDVLSASYKDDKIAWYENDGAADPSFTEQAAISTDADWAQSVYAADVDGDGDLDVLSASYEDNKIAWYENDGAADPSFTPYTISTDANGTESVYAADVDGDGDLDVLSASYKDDKIAWYENDGAADPSFTEQTAISTDADAASSVYAADVDGDGDMDVLSTFYYDKIAWYENDGAADPSFTPYTISTDGAESVYAADVDGDGDLDVLSASYYKIAWYENDGAADPSFTPHTISPAANGAASVYAADVDGDGDLDVLSASVLDDKIAWYENDGAADPSFTEQTAISTAADGASSVYAADVDGDGDMDVLSASRDDDKIAWYENQIEEKALPVAYHVGWPDLPPLLSVGETVYERAKSGISGVANQLAVSRIYDDLAPGEWSNYAQKIVIEGAEVQRSLAELVDPVGEVRVALDITIDGNPSLPEEIKSERLLFGGGQAIVGNKTDPDLALPFSLRSRILFDDTNGELIFRGYYDGASPEYIKGDPLLLLNVMSKSGMARLHSLCPDGGDAYPYDESDCGKYKKAIEDLYHKTRNPRQVDLCRTADGKLYADDPDPAANQGDEQADISQACEPLSDGTETNRDGEPDQAFLIGVQDADDNGIPEPYEGLGKGKALTAGNAAGTGYITVVYNNDPSLGGLPVSLQVIKVGCTKNHLGEDSTYRGNLLVIKSDNLFDEKLTLRHTGDFGGQPGNFEFEWYIAEVDETAVSPTALPPNYPWRKWTRVEPGADDIGPEITIEGANPTTLSDNWLIMRYKNYPCCGNNYRYSAFAGDPSAKPSEVRGQLAEGWIKRVVGALNPFDTRVDDFVSAPVNTTVDMVRQAGPRYEGPIALSNDPEVLNQIGLIEAYQTVLDRGRDLSIDSSINHQGANAALLNVTSRIADLYMLLGNDAYMDALDPTVGLGTSSALASRAPVIFSFMNQFRSDSFGLIDEELGLLRGRDETLGGVAAAPTYNRLTWNFTNGEGEVAYVLNYNIKDMNQDGFVNEADAAIMYPQGHGDAWGHHLTAIKKYYELLRHPHYTWVPRAEPVSVAGAPVVVDYYDERRFAIAAAAKARMGAEIVDLTYRKQYSDPDSQEYVDSQVDPSDDRKRAWGVADWARRAGQGAYFDWVMANAVLPPEDDRYTDVRKIDRTTVLEIGEVSDQYRQIQGQLDDADGGLNPLGLAQGAVLFDLDPALIAAGETHFEQVYERAIASLGNTLVLFDYANEMKLAERASQDARRDFVTTITEKDTALMNELIGIFGYPYDADIGVNGTYPDGYDGPDIYNYDLWDRTALTDHEKRCSDADRQDGSCAPETTTYTIEHGPLECLGLFPKKYRLSIAYGELCSDVNLDDESDKLEIQYTVGIGLDKGRGRFKPSSWPEESARKAPGDIQNALQALNQARLQYEMAIRAYQNHVKKIDGTQKKIQEKAIYLETIRGLKHTERWAVWAIDQAVHALKLTTRLVKEAGTTTKTYAEAMSKCPPEAVGVASDATAPVRCTIEIGGKTVDALARGIAWALGLNVDALGFEKDLTKVVLETAILEVSQDYDLRQFGKQMGGLLRDEKQLRLALYLAQDRVNGAQGDYDAAVQKGFRKLNELIRLRKRWAGQVSEQRYSDMAYRIFQNDALQKYRQQFDLAQRYTYLTAAAYDYETNLSRDDPAMGDQFLRQIVGVRTLGHLRYLRGVGWEPVVGSRGLADPLGRMKDNFEVLKGQMGFNNPQSEANRFSLRSELLRLRDDSDTDWRQELMRYYTPNIYNHDDVARLAKQPYGEVGSQPGLVIPIGSTVSEGLNFFGLPLGPGDSAYDATQFATKIAAVGVWFEGYDTERLAQTPRVYLLPGGKDVIRPRNTDGVLRYWNIVEQMLPVPHPIGQADLENPDWIARNDGLDGQMFAIKPYVRFRAYPFTSDFTADEMNTDTRLIGRSVWNTEWLLVISGTTLLADPQVGIERFIEDVDDVYIYFQTYAYAGN